MRQELNSLKPSRSECKSIDLQNAAFGPRSLWLELPAMGSGARRARRRNRALLKYNNRQLKLEPGSELDLPRFAKSGGDGTVEVECQWTRHASLVSVIEHIEQFEDTFQLHSLTELESLRSSKIEREEFVVEALSVPFDG